MLTISPSFASGLVEASVRLRITVRNRCSGLPCSGSPSIPKMPAMITSSVIACIRGASSIVSSTGQRSISRRAASAIIAE